MTTTKTFGPVLLVLYLLLGLALPACSTAQARVEPGTRVDVPEQGPEPGQPEADVRGHFASLLEILSAERDDPHETVVALGRYLDIHRDEIRRLVREIETRVAAMTTPERLYYEERFAEYFAPLNRQWSDALQAFRDDHPEAAIRIDGLMIYFD